MADITLNTPSGQGLKVSTRPIDDFNLSYDRDATNCVLIITKEVGDELSIISIDDICGHLVTVKNHFAAWPRKNDDGTWAHIGRILGGNHYAVIPCNDAIETRRLTADLLKLNPPVGW